MIKKICSATLLGSLFLSPALFAGELHELIMKEQWGKALQKISEGEGIQEKNAEQGFTPLHNASYKGYMPVVMALVEAGADVNARDARGFTPLHHASYMGHEKVEAYLLKKGANPDIKGLNGKTAKEMEGQGVGKELKAVELKQEKGGNRVWGK